MKIKLAQSLGYCLGVRRAMDMAFRRLSRRGEKVYSHGELIHNNPALELLTEKGLKLWRGETQGAVIVRAHGLAPEEMENLKRQGLSVSDATCPRVLKVQRLVAKEAEAGRGVIIWGAADHPEVIGLMGHAQGRGRVVKNAAQVAELPPLDKVLLVSQTTQDLEKCPEVEAAVKARWPEAMIVNTICEATVERQGETLRLATEVDALLVIGGKTSGNTARLADIGRRQGVPTYLAETENDLEAAWFKGVETLGVTAGASTAKWQVSRIVEAIRAMARPRVGLWPRLIRALVLSNIFAALGLAGLSQAAAVLMGLPLQPIIFSFFFFQALALHLFRDFTLGRTVRFTDPDRQMFMDKYRRPLKVFGGFSFLMAGAGAALGGGPLGLIMAVMWLGALIHQFLPRPRAYENWNKSRALIKPVALGAGWGAALVLAVLSGPPWEAGAPATALWAGLAVGWPIFVLAVMGDVLGAQGDQIFGRPSLPIILGEKKTRTFLKRAYALWAIWLGAGWLMGAPPPALLMILSGPLYNAALLKALFGGPHGHRFEGLMFGQLILTSILAAAWAI